MTSPTDKAMTDLAADEAATWVAAAEELVRWAASQGAQDLDFTWRSVGRLDQLIERLSGSKDPITLKTKLGCAAYVGEVLVRQFGGSWATGEHYGEIMPPGGTGPAAADAKTAKPSDTPPPKPAKPTDMVERRLTEGLALQHQVFEQSKNWSVSEVIAAAATEAEQAVNDREQAASMMRAVAETFVGPATANGAVWLDYSPASVMLLDDLIAAWWPATPEKGTFESMVPAMGAYIGEVLVKETGAHWIRDPEEGYAVELDGRVVYPMKQVAGRFEMGREQSIGLFFSETSSSWAPKTEQAPAVQEPAKPKRRFFGRR